MNSSIRIYIIIVFLACHAWNAVAQERKNAELLSFVIRDATDRHPLNDVTCRVMSAGGKFYAYAISDSGGKLTVSARKSDILEFSAMGYGTQKMKAGSCSQGKTNVVELAEQAIELREITVKAPPIRAMSDTIAYNVASFLKPGDTHLEDILKKLPGIKVSENGSVSYQGKAINKFYIEGKDLLGSSYNQATRNMPVDAVTTVEVLENHQPVKMLQGHQFSDKAALNIKIDKGHKLRPFGEVEGGIGGTPAIWDNRIFLTQIFDKDQLLITGKMNNTGVDLSDETMEHIDVTDLDAYEPVMSPILSTATGKEELPLARYLRNKSYSVGANYLKSLSADATLRINLLLFDGSATHTNTYKYTYGGENTVSVSEYNDMKKKDFTILPVIKYELNNKNTFVSDEFRYSFSRTSAYNTLVSNDDRLTERTYSRPSYFQNYLTSAFSLGKQIVQFKSLLRYFNRREALDDVSDSEERYNVSERFATRSFVAKNIISSSVPLWRNSLRMSAKVYYKDNVYDYDGEMHNSKLRLRLLPSYEISWGAENVLSVDVPVEWNRIRVYSHAEDGNSRCFFSFSPEIYLKHQLTHRWKIILSASTVSDNIPADFYSPLALRTGYRTRYVPNNNIFTEKDRRVSLRLNYRDLASMFFSNLSVSYTDSKKECYTNYYYTDALTTISLVRGDNHRRMLVANAQADKNFTDAGLSLKSEIGYNRISYLLSQSGVQTDNKSNITTASLSAIYQKLKWLKVTVGAQGTLYWEDNDYSNSGKLKSLSTNTSIQIFPVKAVDMKVVYYSYINEISPSSYKNCNLMDVTANCRICKKWETGVSLTNIFNTKSYVVTQDSGIDTFYSSLPLRGREFLFRLLLRI